MDISAIIVTYNNASHIKPCLQSFLSASKDLSAQIVIVDNHSTDQTRPILMQFESMPHCHLELVLNDRNIFFTKALNLGLTRARGEAVLVLNPDTELQGGALRKMLDIVARDKQVGVVAPQLLNADGTVQQSCRRFPRRRDVLSEIAGLSRLFPGSDRFNRWKMGDFDHLSQKSVEQPQGACLLFRRSALAEIGYWDERFEMFFSDVDWCKRVKSAGLNILFEPCAQVLHHKGASVRQARARMIWTSHRSFYHFFKKHRRKFPVANEIFGAILFLTAVARIAAQSGLDIYGAIRQAGHSQPGDGNAG